MNTNGAPEDTSMVPDGPSTGSRLARGALGGTVAAMAMSGVRAFTVNAGLLEQTPPQAIFRQKATMLFATTPRKKWRAGEELMHWTYGAVGGVAFALMPEEIRRHRLAGLGYGLGAWAGFEAVLAPMLGLKQSKKVRPVERLVLAGDHLLYGLILAEFVDVSRD